MEYQYDYIVIDAQYYLRRNWSVVSNLDDFSGTTLISSFLFSVLKYSKAYPARKIILVWDKKPYKKEEIIKEYKGDRYLVCVDYDDTENQANKVKEKLKEPTLTDEEKEKLNQELDGLNKKLKELEVEVNKFKILGMTKYELLSKFENFGLVSMNIPGYEADDLAYLISLWSQENKKKCLLVSGDGDWICMTNAYTDVCRWTRQPTMYINEFNYLNIPDEYKDKLTSFELYQLNDIYYGGHNNVVLDLDREKVSFSEFVKIAIADEPSDIKFYYDALRLKGYYDDYIKNIITKKLTKDGRLNLDEYQIYQDANKLLTIDGNYIQWYYRSVIKKQDKDLFEHEEEQFGSQT